MNMASPFSIKQEQAINKQARWRLPWKDCHPSILIGCGCNLRLNSLWLRDLPLMIPRWERTDRQTDSRTRTRIVIQALLLVVAPISGWTTYAWEIGCFWPRLKDGLTDRRHDRFCSKYHQKQNNSRNPVWAFRFSLPGWLLDCWSWWSLHPRQDHILWCHLHCRECQGGKTNDIKYSIMCKQMRW